MAAQAVQLIAQQRASHQSSSNQRGYGPKPIARKAKPRFGVKTRSPKADIQHSDAEMIAHMNRQTADKGSATRSQICSEADCEPWRNTAMMTHFVGRYARSWMKGVSSGCRC